MRYKLNKLYFGNAIVALMISATASYSAVFFDDFQIYDAENPSDFSTNGVPLGTWVPSSTAANATRTYSTANYGGTRLWISNVNGTSITSAGITVESNTQYRLSACLVLETQYASSTGTASYDVLLGTNAATAVSLIGGPVEVTVRGDDAGGAQDNTYNDQITTALFNVGAVAPDEKVFLVFKRISASSWFGVDNVVVNKTLPSGDLKFSYDMLIQPGSQNLDGVGGNDFWGAGQIPVNGGGFAVQTNAVQNLFFRTDFTGPSIWRSEFLTNRNYTIEFRVNITTNATEGTGGTLSHQARRSTAEISDSFELRIKSVGFGTSGIGTNENNVGWHTYRLACSESGNQVWRDGIPVNGRLIPISGSGNNDTFFGDWSSDIGGEYYIDYYRLDPTGAYAPTPDINNVVRMQWGLDYTSGNVADQNEGLVEDDSSSGNDGQVHWNSPDYSSDVPPAGKLRGCSGIGSFDLATTGHASVQTVGNNFIFMDELEAAGGLTMEVWAKQTATAGTSAMIMTMQDVFTIASEPGKYRVVVNSFSNPGPEFAISESEKNSAGWTHFAAVLKDFTSTGAEGTNYSATVELWINGQLKDSQAIDYAPSIDLVRPAEVGSSHISSAASTAGMAIFMSRKLPSAFWIRLSLPV